MLSPTTQRTARHPIFDNRNYIGVDDPTASVTRIPVINVLGELDGSAPGGQHQAAESGFQQHTFVEEGYDGDVAVSPDGKWLVYSSTRHNERPDIYLQRVDGLSVTQLTSDETDDAYPTFSPDGRQIAFASTRAGSWDIYVNPPTSGSLPTPNAAAIGRTFASSYLTVPSGQANIIRLTNAGSGGTLQNISVPSLAAGQVTTIVVTDAATGVAGLRTFTLAACT
jgi:Tol biopolymer transport system component